MVDKISHFDNLLIYWRVVILIFSKNSMSQILQGRFTFNVVPFNIYFTLFPSSRIDHGTPRLTQWFYHVTMTTWT